MKKSALFFILAIVSTLPLLSQVIPNGDMEAWTASTSYDEPTGWGTPNPFIPGIIIVSKSTDVHGGSFAARLESQNLGIVVVPGVMGTGNVNPLAFNIVGGFPVSTAYESFTGYYKFYPQGTDSCWIFALFTKWNSTSGSRDTVAFANFFGGSTPSYTQFTAPVFYTVQETPDSAIVVVVTTKNVLLGSDSSVLYVDDMTFTGNVGIDPVSTAEIHAYPNPAKDKFTIELPAGSGAKLLNIYDVLGNRIKSLKVETSVITFNTESFANGLYFYQLEDNLQKPLIAGKFSVKH